MRNYEEANDPVPPGHGEDEPNDAPEPVCQVCGRLARKRYQNLGWSHTLACDVHPYAPIRWQTRKVQA
jgi:hypothetical protein